MLNTSHATLIQSEMDLSLMDPFCWVEMILRATVAKKFDVKKAFHTRDWKFLLKVLSLFGFDPKFCGWISTILSLVHLSFSFNGSLWGYLAKWGWGRVIRSPRYFSILLKTFLVGAFVDWCAPTSSPLWLVPGTTLLLLMSSTSMIYWCFIEKLKGTSPLWWTSFSLMGMSLTKLLIRTNACYFPVPWLLT